MKKFFLLTMLAAGLLTASAEQVTVTFEGTNGSTFTPPEGWTIQGESSDFRFIYMSDGSVRGSSTSSSTYVSNPILVTPQVMGDVIINYKVDEGDDYGDDDYGWGSYDDGGTIEFWDYMKSGDTYTKGSSLGYGYATSYANKTVTVEPGHCVGIELDSSQVMSVTYTLYDPSQDTEERRALTLTSPKYVSTPLYADENNNVEIGINLTVTNSGNVTLNPGDEGYSLTIFTTTHGDLVTIPMTETLAAGEQKAITVTGSFPISLLAAKSSPSSNGAYYVGFRVREDLKQTYQTMSRSDVYPYELKCQFQNGNISTAVTALDFGFLTGTASQTITLMNQGSRVVNVTAMDVPAGFTVDATAPFTVASARETEHSRELTISVNEDASGIINGTLSLTIEGADEPLTLDLSGVVASGDNFFENFEGAEMPAGWIIDSTNLTLTAPDTKAWGEGNTHVLANSKSTVTARAITPRLTATEGETLVFQAAPANTYGSYPKVSVYYSTNRLDWTLLKNIVNPSSAGEDDEKFASSKPSGSSDVAPLIYTIDMPAGEGYLAFDICYARIDNVYGCHAAVVEHDLMFTASNVPSAGVVNHAINTSATVKNLNTTVEAAGSYTMEMLVNGEVAATITETPELATAEVPFEASFTPHEAGTYTVRYRLTIGENYTLETSDYTIEVAAESANADITVGTGTLISTPSSSYTTPLCNYYKNTHSELVFTQDYLAQYGITPGTKLTGIAFNGYYDKALTGTYKVYLTATELSAIAPADAVELTDDMLVYSNTSFTQPAAGATDTAVPVLKVTFDTPYTYNGGNMLLGIVGELSGWSSNCKYIGDASEEMVARAILQATDSSITATTEWKQSKMFAQTVFSIEQTPANIAGVIYGDNDKTITVADAEVVLTSGDVMYKGTSDENGAYSIDVFQSDKDYNVSVNASGYNLYTSENPVSFADGDVNIEIVLTAEENGVDGIAAEGCNVRIAGDMITVEGATDVRLAIYSVNGMLCGSAAQNTISTADLAAGIYVLRVEAAEGTNTVRFIKK